MFHVYQTCWCYSQGLTSSILSPIPALSRTGRMVPLSCISLLTDTPQQKQTMKLQAPPCLLVLWVVLRGGGLMEPFDTVRRVKKKKKKETRPVTASSASRGICSNAAAFTETTPGRVSQPNRTLRLDSWWEWSHCTGNGERSCWRWAEERRSGGGQREVGSYPLHKSHSYEEF